MSEGVSLSDQKKTRVCVVACDGRGPGVVTLTLDPKRPLGPDCTSGERGCAESFLSPIVGTNVDVRPVPNK